MKSQGEMDKLRKLRANSLREKKSSNGLIYPPADIANAAGKASSFGPLFFNFFFFFF